MHACLANTDRLTVLNQCIDLLRTDVEDDPEPPAGSMAGP